MIGRKTRTSNLQGAFALRQKINLFSAIIIDYSGRRNGLLSIPKSTKPCQNIAFAF